MFLKLIDVKLNEIEQNVNDFCERNSIKVDIKYNGSGVRKNFSDIETDNFSVTLANGFGFKFDVEYSQGTGHRVYLKGFGNNRYQVKKTNGSKYTTLPYVGC